MDPIFRTNNVLIHVRRTKIDCLILLHRWRIIRKLMNMMVVTVRLGRWGNERLEGSAYATPVPK